MTPRNVIAAVALFLFVPAVLPACSALAVVKDGRVVLAGNDDEPLAANVSLRATPGRDGLFGRVCVSRNVVPEWSPFGTMCLNDQGLALTHANTPPGNNPHDPDKPQFRHNFTEKIVAEAATVRQAVAIAQAYTFPPGHEAGMHMMLADASGDAAVVEWVAGEIKVIRRTGPSLLMTNSFVSRPEAAGGPNSRYNRGLRMLPNIAAANAESVFPVMREISVGAVIKGQQVGTLYSGVWDITRRELHLVYKRDYDHPRTFSLVEELAKGEHSTPLSELFPNPVPFETAWRDENGPVRR